MARLANAPVEYVLAVLRFPRLPEVNGFASALQARIRSDFPYSDEIDAPHVNVVIGPEGLQVEQEAVKLWQFTSEDRKWAVIVNAGMVGLHTVDYHDNADFIRRFEACVAAAADVPDVGVRHVEAIAWRYVDVVRPAEGEGLEAYVIPEMLPSTVKGMDGMRLDEGVFAAKLVTEVGGMRLQVLRNPPTPLPPELNSAVVEANGWTFDRPTGDFAVIDTDHGMTFSPPTPLVMGDLASNMRKLHGPIRTVFDSVVTRHGMAAFAKKEETE